VDDAVAAPVPAGLPAGDYQLAVALVAADDDAETEPPTVIGGFTLPASPVDPLSQRDRRRRASPTPSS
jgi:hypothetical protein